METPCLNDPNVFPDDAVLSAHLGRKKALWDLFQDMVRTDHASLAVEWKYYRDGKSWLCKATRRGKAMCWISVYPNAFKVTFYVGSKNDREIENAGIDQKLKDAFFNPEKTTKFRPLTVAMNGKSALKDVHELLLLKERIG